MKKEKKTRRKEKKTKRKKKEKLENKEKNNFYKFNSKSSITSKF